jgi:hypothetical protein
MSSSAITNRYSLPGLCELRRPLVLSTRQRSCVSFCFPVGNSDAPEAIICMSICRRAYFWLKGPKTSPFYKPSEFGRCVLYLDVLPAETSQWTEKKEFNRKYRLADEEDGFHRHRVTPVSHGRVCSVPQCGMLSNGNLEIEEKPRSKFGLVN